MKPTSHSPPPTQKLPTPNYQLQTKKLLTPNSKLKNSQLIMSELAQQLIAECKRTKSKFLDLGNCGLTEWPEELFDCVWLEELNMGELYQNFEEEGMPSIIESKNKYYLNNLRYIPGKIQKIKLLKKLYIRGNIQVGGVIQDLQALEYLSELEVLDLSFNKISDLSFLRFHQSLRSLSLSVNLISDASYVGLLQNLEYLNLGYNKIKNLDFLSSLKELKSLNLRGNRLSGGRGIAKSKKLRSIFLGNNFINHFDFLTALPNIKYLDLNNNKIKNLRFFSSLKNLELLSDLSQVRNLHLL